MSHKAAIGNLGKDGIPQKVRDELTVIPSEQIKEVLLAASIRTSLQPHRLMG